MRPFYKALIEIQSVVEKLRPVDPYYSRLQDIFVTIAPAVAAQPIYYSWNEVSGISAEKQPIKDLMEREHKAMDKALNQKHQVEACPKTQPRKRLVPREQLLLPGMGMK